MIWSRCPWTVVQIKVGGPCTLRNWGTFFEEFVSKCWGTPWGTFIFLRPVPEPIKNKDQSQSWRVYVKVVRFSLPLRPIWPAPFCPHTQQPKIFIFYQKRREESRVGCLWMSSKGRTIPIFSWQWKIGMLLKPENMAFWDLHQRSVNKVLRPMMAITSLLLFEIFPLQLSAGKIALSKRIKIQSCCISKQATLAPSPVPTWNFAPCVSWSSSALVLEFFTFHFCLWTVIVDSEPFICPYRK